eukprot:bmy_16269T0
MRLTKPTLFTNIPVTCEEKDLPGDLFNQLMRDDPSTVNGAEILMLGEMNIFLGETFSSYISVHNDSNQVVKDILVKLGVCSELYNSGWRKNVLKPLDVKTKFYNAESDLSSVTDEVFLEAQIQNITTSPMFMEKVSLEPSIIVTTFGSRAYLQPMDTRQYLYCLKPKKEFAEKAGIIKGVTVIGKLDIVWKTNLGERGRLQTSQLQRMAPGYGDVRLSLEAIPDTVNLEEPFHITCKITNCREIRKKYSSFRITKIPTSPLFISVPGFLLDTQKRNSPTIVQEILQYLFVKGTRFILVFLIPPAVKGRWISFWKCAIPVLSTGVAFQEDSLESSIQVPLSALPSLYCLQYRDCKYALFSIISSVSGLRLTDTFLKRTYEYDDIAQVCVVSSAIKVES